MLAQHIHVCPAGCQFLSIEQLQHKLTARGDALGQQAERCPLRSLQPASTAPVLLDDSLKRILPQQGQENSKRKRAEQPWVPTQQQQYRTDLYSGRAAKLAEHHAGLASSTCKCPFPGCKYVGNDGHTVSAEAYLQRHIVVAHKGQPVPAAAAAQDTSLTAFIMSATAARAFTCSQAQQSQASSGGCNVTFIAADKSEVVLPAPALWGRGWASLEVHKAARVLKTEGQRCLIAGWAEDYVHRRPVPSAEQQREQCNDGQPPEQRLTDAQISQFVKLCVAAIRDALPAAANAAPDGQRACAPAAQPPASQQAAAKGSKAAGSQQARQSGARSKAAKHSNSDSQQSARASKRAAAPSRQAAARQAAAGGRRARGRSKHTHAADVGSAEASTCAEAGSADDRAKVAAFVADVAEAEHEQRCLRHTRAHTRSEACIRNAGQAAPSVLSAGLLDDDDDKGDGCCSESSESDSGDEDYRCC